MNIKPSQFKRGTRVNFFPVLGAHHTAEGVITETRNYKGTLFADVATDTLNGGIVTNTVFTILPEDVRWVVKNRTIRVDAPVMDVFRAARCADPLGQAVTEKLFPTA